MTHRWRFVRRHAGWVLVGCGVAGTFVGLIAVRVIG
jgi:hypothetical protein